MLILNDQKMWDGFIAAAEFAKENQKRSIIVPLDLLFAIEEELKQHNIFDQIELVERARLHWSKFIDNALRTTKDWSMPRAFKVSDGSIFIFIESIRLGRQGLTFNQEDWKYKKEELQT